MAKWSELVLDRIVQENELVRSLYFSSLDGEKLARNKAGQFITLELPATEERKRVRRSYTLSNVSDGNEYRVTVKKQLPPAYAPDSPPGIVSSHLLDEAQEGDRFLALEPNGKFGIDVVDTRPVTMYGIGIGVTPMVAMLGEQVQANPERAVQFINVVRNKDEEALLDEVRECANQYPNVNLHIGYTRPRDQDVLGTDYDSAGRIDAVKFKEIVANPDGVYYLCGTNEFVKTVGQWVEDWGIPKEDIHKEGFGGPKVPR